MTLKMEINLSNSIGVLILMYGKNIEYCDTFINIIKLYENIKDVQLKIVLWNNGPNKLEDPRDSISMMIGEVGLDVDYVETIDNMPISAVYNNFIENYHCKWYVIFDDDSNPGASYFNFFKEGSIEFFDIMTPIIRANSVFLGPSCDKKIISESRDVVIKKNTRFMFIGSGLALNRRIIDRVKKKYGDVFDERYALYGVDTTFCLRLKFLSEDAAVRWRISSEMTHSLSRLTKVNRASAAMRRKERGIDFGVTIRCYPSLDWVVVLGKVVFNRTFRRDALDSGVPSVFWTLMGIFFGRHPRSKNIK